jgi:hypothetical protein
MVPKQARRVFILKNPQNSQKGFESRRIEGGGSKVGREIRLVLTGVNARQIAAPSNDKNLRRRRFPLKIHTGRQRQQQP